MPHRSALPYPPRVKVCGGTGWITSEAVGSGFTLSRSPTPRRSGSVRAAHPRFQPEGSQDTRGLCRSRVERFVSTAAPHGQGAVTPCCIVLTIVQFQTETDALRSIFIGLKALQFQGFQRQEQRRKRSVLSEIGQKQLPVPLGRLCPFEYHL